MELTGAQIVLECLKEQNVNTIFGYPGGAVIPLYDALYDYEDSFLHVRTCHEQGAVHGADGYARSTGKVGVCFATSGPGATNTVTGIATAYMDSVPLIVITGQVPQSLLGRDSFQEIDITGMTLPITKHNYLVKNIKDLSQIIREAFCVAQSGRPGPVLIDIPKNIFAEKTLHAKKEISKNTCLDQDWDSNDLVYAAKLINESSRPIIYAGGGVIVSNAGEQVFKFATKGDIPVVNTLMGLGGFPRTNPLSLGLIGMHGFAEANLSVTHSDLVIAIGARFSDRVIGAVDQFAPRAKVIHIDIDKTEIGKNKGVDISLLGDVDTVLEKLIFHVEKKNRETWLEKIKEWKINNKENQHFSPQNILETAYNIMGDETIVTTEVGQHQMWTAQYWKFNNPRTFLSSGGLGTMGYGLGAAIGAQLGNTDKRILHIAGDGSFRMNCNELATVSKHKLPIITLLFNNSTLGMVRQWQKLFNDKRYSQTDVGEEINYIKLAEAFGIKGRKVKDMKNFEKVLREAIDKKEGMVIECILSKEEGVYPIVPPGMPIDHLILE